MGKRLRNTEPCISIFGNSSCGLLLKVFQGTLLARHRMQLGGQEEPLTLRTDVVKRSQRKPFDCEPFLEAGEASVWIGVIGSSGFITFEEKPPRRTS